MIGISSPTFCLSPFDKMLERISEHFQLWEILSEGEDSLERVEEAIVRGRDSLGMRFQVHAPLSDVNIGSAHEPMRQAAMGEIKKTIASCRKLNISLMTLHPGFIQGIAFLDRSKALERTRKSVLELEHLAIDNSVDIALENMPAHINATCTTPEELLKVLDGTEIGMCFDLGHANTTGNVDAFMPLVGRFINVHLHNNAGQWDEHNVIDDGTADIAKVISVLKGSYKGNLIIESTDLETGIISKTKLEAFLR